MMQTSKNKNHVICKKMKSRETTEPNKMCNCLDCSANFQQKNSPMNISTTREKSICDGSDATIKRQEYTCTQHQRSMSTSALTSRVLVTVLWLCSALVPSSGEVTRNQMSNMRVNLKIGTVSEHFI